MKPALLTITLLCLGLSLGVAVIGLLVNVRVARKIDNYYKKYWGM